ncbi:MAG: hypothetical protein D6737_10010 [Chloroflexi bacterium]|nr:MAG: hypothetical protein CUN54_02240 [Phototrophicales bacterium]RMF79891.1 MAG: hypothetical protein D6737_10010 [Chloroflexota bacterium]
MNLVKLLNSFVIRNLIWFAGSVVLAFFVWAIAVTQTQGERQIENVQVQYLLDEGLVITSDAPDTVDVFVRAQDSVLQRITRDEIEVVADLRGLPPGQHTVELKADAARGAIVVDISQVRVRVTLEQLEEKFVPVVVNLISDPPTGFQAGEPQLTDNQVLVTGASSAVSAVEAVRINVDLGGQRNPFEDEVRLLPVDANGSPVPNVTLQPATVGVMIDISQREDIREVPVTPNILLNTLPDGYVLTSVEYDPQVLLVSASPDVLAGIPSTFFTMPVSLAGQTTDFEISVPVELPDDELLVMSTQNIRVSVGITALTGSRQFDSVPVEVIGLGADSQAIPIPDVVTVLLTGPQPLLQELSLDDVQVILDVNGLADGNYELMPTVGIGEAELDVSARVLPAEVSVQIITVTPTAEPRRNP